jgi:hypothetical protein
MTREVCNYLKKIYELQSIKYTNNYVFVENVEGGVVACFKVLPQFFSLRAEKNNECRQSR